MEDNPTLFHYGRGRNSRQRSTLRTCVRASSCSGGLYIAELLLKLGNMISRLPLRDLQSPRIICERRYVTASRNATSRRCAHGRAADEPRLKWLTAGVHVGSCVLLCAGPLRVQRCLWSWCEFSEATEGQVSVDLIL